MIDLRGSSFLLVELLQRATAPLVSALSLYMFTALYGVPFNNDYVVLALATMILSAIFVREGTPERAKIRLFSGQIASILTGWALVVGALLLLAYMTKESATYSRLVLMTWFIVNPFLIHFARYLVREISVHMMRVLKQHRRVVIAGITPLSHRLVQTIHDHDGLGLEVDGFFEDRSAERRGHVEHSEYLGKLSDLPAYVKKHRIDVIYIALPIRRVERVQVLLDELQDTTASVYYVPDIFVFDLIQSRVADIGGIPVLALLETPFFGYNGILKRASDFFASIVILSLIAPVLLAIAIAVKLSSPGPVIFKQRRYGLAGEEIVVYKFRTMTVMEDGDEIQQAQKDDDRFTKIGRWLRARSLDELPQFINVIQGRMSIVGPRPHAVAHNELYRKLIKGYMLRHKVRPGITGWAQVNGCRGETKEVDQMRDRVHYDLEYLRHWSLWFDVKIIFRTMGVLIDDEQAH